MQTLEFSTTIDAKREKVWQVLWDDETYRLWTGLFSEDGSYAVSDWNEGSKISFLTDNKDGMVCTIEKKIDNEFMSFKHLGSIKNGVEVPFGEGMEGWADTVESYALKEVDGKTELAVVLESPDAWVEFFEEKFPLALAKAKELSEN